MSSKELVNRSKPGLPRKALISGKKLKINAKFDNGEKTTISYVDNNIALGESGNDSRRSYASRVWVDPNLELGKKSEMEKISHSYLRVINFLGGYVIAVPIIAITASIMFSWLYMFSIIPLLLVCLVIVAVGGSRINPVVPMTNSISTGRAADGISEELQELLITHPHPQLITGMIRNKYLDMSDTQDSEEFFGWLHHVLRIFAIYPEYQVDLIPSHSSDVQELYELLRDKFDQDEEKVAVEKMNEDSLDQEAAAYRRQITEAQTKADSAKTLAIAKARLEAENQLG